MMCLACEQDAMWFAYLQRKGLITPDGYLVEQPPSLLDPVQSDAAPAPEQSQEQATDQNAKQPVAQSGFSCDDPAAQ
jgi:hypothetical protein